MPGKLAKPRVRLTGANIEDVENITPSDANDLAKVADGSYGAAHGLYVGGTGDVVLAIKGSDVTFTGIADGVWHPMPPFTRVKSTGTTATSMIAGY